MFSHGRYICNDKGNNLGCSIYRATGLSYDIWRLGSTDFMGMDTGRKIFGAINRRKFDAGFFSLLYRYILAIIFQIMYLTQ